MSDLAGSTLSTTDGRPRKTGVVARRPHLYLAFQCDRPLASSARFSLANVDQVIIGRGKVRTVRRCTESGSKRLEIRIPDPWMSSSHAKLSKVFGRWVLEDTRSKNGTLLSGIACEREHLSDRALFELGHTLFYYRDAVMSSANDPPDLDATQLEPAATGLATFVPGLTHSFSDLVQIAASPVSVVIRGESGTGKEVIARALHMLSGRKGPFIAVNCGALPETLIESELFGYKKGAFSGATEDRIGLVRGAEGGTLFLDEIGDLPPSSQAAFLRVLQEREVTPVGATQPIPVNIRVVAATHRDLQTQVRNEHFRKDLFARITGFTVVLPPLRERREDLGLLVDTLLRRVAPHQASEVTFTCAAGRRLFSYEWPLNVRELEKCLTTAVVLAGKSPIDIEHLPSTVRHGTGKHAATEQKAKRAKKPLSKDDEKLRDKLTCLLKQHGGNISAVSRAMGKARMQIQRWIRRFEIDTDVFRQ